jgi:hypothetical protein
VVAGPEHHPGHTDVDVVQGLQEEAARALGRAGGRLERALFEHRRAATIGLSPAEERAHLDRIAARLYALLVQRECAGATHRNLEAICAVYEIPEGALRRL